MVREKRREEVGKRRNEEEKGRDWRKCLIASLVPGIFLVSGMFLAEQMFCEKNVL